jgi:putative CocE/NonD family hydrolase
MDNNTSIGNGPAYPGVSVEIGVMIPMRDGVRLSADIYTPTQEGVFPVLVIRTPYNKTTAQSEVAYAHPAWYAAQGYIVVAQDTRGRWGSEGTFYPFLNEGEDGYDTVEFAATLPRSNGKVGTFGFSYAGLNQLLTAVLRPPSLAAIAPAFTSSSPYESWSYEQGAPAIAFLSFWASLLGIGDAVKKGNAGAATALSAAMSSGSSAWALPLSSDKALTRENAPYYRDWLDHPRYDGYWKRWTLDEDFSRINVPGLHIMGQWDVFAKGTARTFRGLRQSSAAAAQQKLVVTPLPHLPWSPLEGGVDVGANVIDDWHLRFFNEHLKGESSDVHAYPVTAYVIGEGWRDLLQWPYANDQALHLHSTGRANSAWGDGKLSLERQPEDHPDIYIYDPSQPILSAGGHSTGVQGLQPLGPKDQVVAERSKAVLAYTGPRLEEPVTLIGDVSLVLYAATSAVDTDFTARLTVVGADGVSKNILEGIVRASHRTGSVAPTPVGDGVHEYRINLGPIARVIPTGSSLRVLVSSSDFPLWGRHPNTGDVEGNGGPVIATQTIHHSHRYPSRLELPVAK